MENYCSLAKMYSIFGEPHYLVFIKSTGTSGFLLASSSFTVVRYLMIPDEFRIHKEKRRVISITF